jgi:alkylation response protein AidB-like acyl-CoA dehydrogenase
MDFDLSDEQRDLQGAARQLLDRHAPPARVRAVVDDGGGWDRGLWAAMVEQGWPGIAVPETRGGLGLGWVEAAVLLEEVGAHVAPAPVLGQIVALAALADAEVPDDVLDPLLDGSQVAAVAGTAVAAAMPAEGRDDGSWRLSGRTEPVAFAPSASLLVLPAQMENGDGGELHLFSVRWEPGRSAAEPAMDRTREVGWIELDGTPATLLGGPAAAADHLDRGAVAHAAELLGAAERVLEMSVAYAADRVQFGRPIGSFQAVKHRCADMLVDVEGMRSAVWWAAWCLAARSPDAPAAAATAKAWCSDAAARVMASGLQVHGGIGFTWEHDLHLYLKRAHLDQVAFGDGAVHRGRLAALLKAGVEQGGSPGEVE